MGWPTGFYAQFLMGLSLDGTLLDVMRSASLLTIALFAGCNR